MRKRICVLIGRLINFAYPKTPNKICIFTTALRGGNAAIFYEHAKNDPRFETVAVLNQPDPANPHHIAAHSLKGILHLLSSRFVVTSHYTLNVVSRRQIVVHLWHGIPIKSIRREITNERKARYQTTVSAFADLIFAHERGMRPRQFIHTGEPIYDYFNKPQDYLSAERHAELLKLEDKVLYAPTHRRAPHSSEGIHTDRLISEMINVSKKTHQHIMISPHPLDQPSPRILSEIESTPSVSLAQFPTDIMLPYVKTVILDISSLYFQALYLKKNVIIYFPDQKDYQEDLELIFPYLEIFPDEILADNEDALLRFIKHPPSIEATAGQLRKLMFPTELQNCSQKILDIMQQEVSPAPPGVKSKSD